jgi:putative hydroxymethylpyrimidine transport system permease protein
MTPSSRLLRSLGLVWPALVLLVLWQVWIAAANVPAVVAPAPAAVVAEIVRNPVLYAGATAITAGVAGLGLLIGMSLAVACAIAVWLTPVAGGLLTVPALLVQSTPIVALLPILARLFGYGEPTVVVSAAAITFLPTFVIVGAGLRRSPAGSADLFVVLGASRFVTLRYLALPAAVPSMLTALRIAAANSVLAALVAEYLMGQAGLGSVFADAQSQLLSARAWSASLLATVLSVAAFAAAQRFERGRSSLD